MDETSDKSCLRADLQVRGNLRGRVWEEAKLVWGIAFPTMLARGSSYGLLVVTQIYIGHISEIDLAAYGLIQSVLLLFANGILIGMSSATETLCGQAFGAGQYHMLGIYLQRSLIVSLITVTVLLPIFIFATPIFLLLGEEEIAIAAGEISVWFIPYTYSFAFAFNIQMFLYAQLKYMIVVWLWLGSFVLVIPLSWILEGKLGLGVNGAMIALNVSAWSNMIGVVVYVLGGWCPDTWKGFTKAAFTDLLPVIKLSISSGIMLCLVLWYDAVPVLLAGYMRNVTVAVSAISLCVRVANELGRGNAKAATFSVKVILCNSTAIGGSLWILFLVLGKDIAHLVTSNTEVAESMSSLCILLAFSILLNSIQTVLSGIAIGAGLQATVAIVNVCCYYIIGLPIGILLGYVANYEIQGLWAGMLCGVLVQTLVLGFLTWRINWDEQVNEASKRLNRFLLEPTE